MITQYLIELFTGIFLGFTESVLPEVDVDETADWTTQAFSFFGSIWKVNQWIPISTIVACFLLLVSVAMLVMWWKAGYTLWKGLPFT